MFLTLSLRFLLSAVAAVIALAGPAQALAEEQTLIRDVVYSHKVGMALTLDVVKPAKPNGARRAGPDRAARGEKSPVWAGGDLFGSPACGWKYQGADGVAFD